MKIEIVTFVINGSVKLTCIMKSDHKTDMRSVDKDSIRSGFDRVKILLLNYIVGYVKNGDRAITISCVAYLFHHVTLHGIST